MFKSVVNLLVGLVTYALYALTGRIKPWVSQGIGLLMSGFVGLVVYGLVVWFIQHTLNFWYLEEILRYIPAAPLGALAAYEMFFSCRYEVPVGRVGVAKIFGSLTEITFTDGIQWVPFFVKIITEPGPDEKFVLSIPGTRIGTQDGTEVYFGTFAPNSIQYSITDAVRYIVVDDPEAALCAEYMGAAKMFFGQAAEAAAARNEGRLFPDFVMLPSKGEDDVQHAAFFTRLEAAKFKDADGTEDDLFSPEALRMLRDEAGTFASNTKLWGIGNVLAFVPDVREDPATQEATEKLQAAEQAGKTLSVKMASLTAHLKGLTDLDVNPNAALAATLKVSGENVEFVHRDMPEFMGMPGGVAAGINQHRKGRNRHGNKQRSQSSGGAKAAGT
ncbi:MAG: hypothetical protein WCT45_02310 [Candidatus Paceibacterota bacterium]|jgi:hypothetical protein